LRRHKRARQCHSFLTPYSTYTITATNTFGKSSQQTATFHIDALTVDASTVPTTEASLLFDKQLAPIAAAAIRRLETQFGSQADAALAGVTVKVANLPGGLLGETSGKTIWIDNNAAGYGWYVDSTPDDDLEFANSLAAHEDPAVANRVDLLTAVMHGMGHVLGFHDTTGSDLMASSLPLGTRRDPSTLS
jgi:hypothetical protein